MVDGSGSVISVTLTTLEESDVSLKYKLQTALVQRKLQALIEVRIEG
jgi:hypothetical protein